MSIRIFNFNFNNNKKKKTKKKEDTFKNKNKRKSLREIFVYHFLFYICLFVGGNLL